MLRPAFEDRGAVVFVYMAGVDLVGLFDNCLARAMFFARAPGRLKRGGAYRPQQFDEMRAALDTAEEFQRFFAPAGPYGRAFERFEVGRDCAAGRVRPFIGHCFRVVDQQVEVYREPQPHAVHGLPGGALAAAVAARMRVGLAVDQVAFDIP